MAVIFGVEHLVAAMLIGASAAMGAVLVCLYERDTVDLDYVVTVAALACTRAGADAPTAEEVSAFRQA